MLAEKSFILTGMPRSGTTYLAAVLHDPPRTICQSEAKGAWKRAWKANASDDQLLGLVSSMREAVEQGRPVSTFDGTAGYNANGRVDTWNQRKSDRVIEAEPEFRFGVKNPEIFLDWLPRWRSLGFRIAITIRHPAAIINSWLGKRERQLARGRAVEGTFGNGDATTFTASGADALDRCIQLHEHLAGPILENMNDPGILLVRYASWFDPLTPLAELRSFFELKGEGGPFPPPIRPEPPTHLPPDGLERIRLGCTSAAALGFDTTPSAWADSVL